MIDIGSDYSGVGAFEQALERLGISFRTVFACDKDRSVRKSYLANYKKPQSFPRDVYDREIPEKSLDLYMTSPPCQGFSIAGKRKGSILFLNSHEFIKENLPRFFIFENVKGLLSHDKPKKENDYGNTFNQWLYYLGGKSINGSPVIFPHESSVPYHIYHTLLNSKNYGVPQNRDRVFIVGIRDDQDNFFSWPKKIPLVKKLKDILESDVDDKYLMSEKAKKSILFNDDNLQKSKINPDIAATLQTPGHACGIYKGMTAIQMNPSKESGGQQPYQQNRVYSDSGLMVALDTDSGRRSVYTDNDIRRLTPRECFRLQDFPEDFKFVVSDSQLYKQAGNSITVAVLENIINKLSL